MISRLPTKKPEKENSSKKKQLYTRDAAKLLLQIQSQNHYFYTNYVSVRFR